MFELNLNDFKNGELGKLWKNYKWDHSVLGLIKIVRVGCAILDLATKFYKTKNIDIWVREVEEEGAEEVVSDDGEEDEDDGYWESVYLEEDADWEDKRELTPFAGNLTINQIIGGNIDATPELVIAIEDSAWLWGDAYMKRVNAGGNIYTLSLYAINNQLKWAKSELRKIQQDLKDKDTKISLATWYWV